MATLIPTIADNIVVSADGQFMGRKDWLNNFRPFDVVQIIAEGTAEWFDFILEHKLYN